MKTLFIVKRTATIQERKATGNRWSFVREFDNPGKADQWLMNHIRTNGYSSEDFIITRVEA